MIRRLGLAMTVAVALAAVPGTADASSRTDRVAVTGEGHVRVRPDIMLVRAGVEVRRPDAEEAYRATVAAAARLVRVVLRSGVAERDIQTTELSVQPEYVEGKYPEISDYRGAESVTATVRDLDRAPATLRAVMSAGEDVRLDGVTFDKADWSAEQDAAEDAAFADAHRKALRYARLAGRQLGRVLSVNAETVDPIPPHVYTKETVAAADGHLSPGEADVRVTVHVVYALA